MRRTPVAGEAESAVAEKTGECDLADIRDRVERRRVGFEHCQPSHDLVGLIDGLCLAVVLRRAEAALILQQFWGSCLAIGERRQAERGEARLRFVRNYLAAA